MTKQRWWCMHMLHRSWITTISFFMGSQTPRWQISVAPECSNKTDNQKKEVWSRYTTTERALLDIPVEYRVIFKMMPICFNALHGTGTLYIKEILAMAKPKGGYNFRWPNDTILLEEPTRCNLQWQSFQWCSSQTLE